MLADALFITGAIVALVMIILAFFHSASSSDSVLMNLLCWISFAAVLIFLIDRISSDLSVSTAALPACLDCFIVETNGRTGEAYSCTPHLP